MMPSAIFAELRLGPCVIKDPDRRQSVSADLAAATASLEALKAKAGAEVKDDPAVTLMAYAVMYQSARAFVHAAGYHITNFRALLSALNELYVKTGKLDTALVEGLEKSQEVGSGTSTFIVQAEQWLNKAKELTR